MRLSLRPFVLAMLWVLAFGSPRAWATVAIRNISWETYPSSLRCVITTETPIQIDQRDFQKEKGLFYVDLYNVHCKIVQPSAQNENAFLKAYRFKGYPAEHVLRIIFYPKDGVSHRVTQAQSPPRVVVECMRVASAASGASPPRATRAGEGDAPPDPVSMRAPSPSPIPIVRLTPARTPEATPAPTPAPTPVAMPAIVVTPPPTPSPTEAPETPAPPVVLAPTPGASVLPAPPTGRRKMIIDPGHGGRNLGAKAKAGSRTVLEKDINPQIARRLAGMIQKAGNLDYYMTRTDDTPVSLAERVKFAQDIAYPGNGQCVFVSIHCNWASNSSARGCEFYYLDETRSEATRELEELENDVEYRDDLKGREKSVLWNILSQMEEDKLKQHKEQGFLLCRYLNLAFQESPYFARHDRGVKSANFEVLKNSLMPAILVETAFLSNREECAALLDEDFQYNVAAAIFNGVNYYFKAADQSFRDLYYPLRSITVR